MSKALVIKGANFSANKVETVTLTDEIPCTGIVLSQDTITATALGGTVNLTATLTPADTTDSVTWESSDTNCATVSTSGVVTIVGVGTAIITATCGTQTATCSVSVSVSYVADDVFTVWEGGTISNSSDRDYVTSSENSTRAKSYFANGNPLDGYKVISKAGDTYADKYPIPLPNNAKTMTISTTGSDYYEIEYVLLNANEKCTYNLDESIKGARAYPYPMKVSHPSDETVIDISDRNEAVNSFCVGGFTDSNKTISTAAKITITFT